MSLVGPQAEDELDRKSSLKLAAMLYTGSLEALSRYSILHQQERGMISLLLRWPLYHSY